MPIADVDEFTEVDAEAELWSRHFRLFVEAAWPQLEPATPFLPNWHIDAICDHLQACADRHIRKLIINVPPGTAKSMLSSVFWPVWVWTRKPTDRFLTASYVDTLSIRDALKSRRLLASTWYQERWGHLFHLTGDQNAKSRYENDKTGIRIATHVGGATGERANIRVLDDPHSIDEVESDDVREGVIDWYRTVWAEREADAKTSVDVVIMQRLHERDLCGYVLEEIGGFEHLCYDDQTEILSRDGWVRFKDLREDCDVLAVNPETIKATWQRPMRYIRYHYDGEMIWYKSDTADLMVTPDHRMVYFDSNDMRAAGWAKGRVRTAHQMPNEFYLPQAVKWRGSRDQREIQFGGRAWKPNNLAEFFGWYLSEGCASKYYTRFVQKPGDKADQLERVLRACPFSFNRRQHTNGTEVWTIGDKLLSSCLATLGKATDKYIPPLVKNLAPASLKKLLLAFALGDGSHPANNSLKLTLASRSKRLIDDLQECGIKAGWACSVSVEHAASREFNGYTLPSGPMWRLYIRASKSKRHQRKWYSRIRPQNIVNIPYSGDVFCVSVPSGAIVVRRNGRVSVSGNCIPMRYEGKRKFVTSIWPQGDPRTVEGELLFPARWDEEAVRDKEKRLRSQASGQLQQRPAPDEGGLFKRHWWQYWHYPGKALPPVPVKLPDGTIEMRKSVPLPDKFDRYLQSWDMTFEETETSDYVVGGQFGKKGANTYHLDLDRAQRDFSDTVRAVKSFNLTWPQPCLKLVEKKANGPAVISTLKDKIPGITPYNPEGSKFARASAYSSVIESGNYFLPHPQIASWVNGFIDELALFPNGKHDDQVDMMSQALDKLYRKDDAGPPVTPEFSRRLHIAEEWILPVPGLECVRFWVGGLHPTCIIAQLLGNGRLNILDAMQLKNGSLRQLIMTRVKPVLARPRYERSLRWRDIGEPDLVVREPRAGEERGSVVIETELKTTVERGIQDWDTRRSALKELFSRNIDGAPMLQVNPRKTEGEDENIVIEALAGGYQYRQTAAGVVQRDAPVLNTAGYVGNALSHALPLLLFPARGPRPQAAGPGRGLARSKGYAVK